MQTSKFIARLNGYDVYYGNGCFTLDPLPDKISTLQSIVSYLVSEGFVNIDELL
jgi:hypothetical protein